MDYFLKEKCPQCGKNLSLGFKYCPHCGCVVNNDGPRVKKTKHFMSNFNPKFNEDNIISKTYNNIYTGISKNLNESETVTNKEIYPIIFQIKDDVKCLRYDEDILLNENSGFFHDYKGYYLIFDKSLSVTLNKKVINSNKKYYLTNNDFISIEDSYFIYTILDQENVNWNKVSMGDEEISNISSSLSFNNNVLLLNYSENRDIYLNNNKIISSNVVSNGDFFTIDSRKFLYKDNFLYFQDELTEGEKTSRAIFANTIREDECLDVNIKNKVVQTKSGPKTLLKDVKFTVKPGELVLVLGSSGAGKSTLFKEFLNQDNPEAEIKLGETIFSENFDLVKRMVATVPQFNLNRDNDTVFMTLKNSGQMKLPSDFTKDEKLLNVYVDEILDMVNLLNVKNSLVKDLSGGEKKRLSIATEYISAPIMFLLDEPDSGLDGYNSRMIMQNLRTIADNNKIVMLISHNPDRTSELFDKILVLGKSQGENCGSLAFFGTPNEAMDFFKTDNIETIVDKLLEDTDYYIEKFREKEE